MAKFGGYGGFGGGNQMQQLMKQAQKMQQEMAKAQEELADTEVVATAGGGMIEVVMSCDRKLSSIKIDPAAVDPDDVEMLEDMIVAAMNEAFKLVEEEHNRIMGPLSGGLGGLI
ncbi:MAG TPA: YbaB/EbfC family nucleoid-associated protein [Candidatus Stercoripulliclostridium merdipullorum]|uniref:Nucleoid-associated protein IAB14_01070 n=1 Tax=Candidatus Stercoripulliclostridium merdipullorum TaxID=2840952 RepID=A0A9D1NBX4_9FIRM|nr:YbaB/EbfC family nucleoid-associated protein [Candidatus Stercoripulliclostridium merdipullorum]